MRLPERLPECLRAPEACRFVNGDSSERLGEDGAASFGINVVVRLEAQEQRAEVWTLGLELGEGAVEVTVAVVQQQDRSVVGIYLITE